MAAVVPTGLRATAKFNFNTQGVSLLTIAVGAEETKPEVEFAAPAAEVELAVWVP